MMVLGGGAVSLERGTSVRPSWAGSDHGSFLFKVEVKKIKLCPSRSAGRGRGLYRGTSLMRNSPPPPRTTIGP